MATTWETPCCSQGTPESVYVDKAIRRLKVEVLELNEQLAACCEEIRALRVCLASKKVLDYAVVSEELKRQRRIHLWNAMICAQEVSLTLFHISGPGALRKVAMSCKAGSEASKSVLRTAAALGADFSFLAGQIYVCGGTGIDGELLRSAETFSPSWQTWHEIPPMSTERCWAAAAVAGGKFYACGGRDSQGSLRTVERYSPRSGVWEAVSSMREVREMAVASTINGTLYVCGGINASGERLCSAERFCADQQEVWEPVEPMMQVRAAASAGVLNGTLYVCGGFDGVHWLSSVEKFDPACGSWHYVPPMLTPRAGAAAAVVKDHLYVCGGWVNGELLCSVESFDPTRNSANSWQDAPSMAFGFCDAAAASLNGRLFILGGDSNEGKNWWASNAGLAYDPSFLQWPSSNAHTYDPSCRQWSRESSMCCKRLAAAAAVVTI